MRQNIVRTLVLFVTLIVTAHCSGADSAKAPSTQPGLAHHAVIISIDGCRPDVLLRADTPVIHHMMKEGTFTFYAETTELANTLPSHTSMITGVKPEVHGIDFNSDPPDDAMAYPRVLTVLEIAHQHGMTTGLFSTKSKFRIYARPNVVDYVGISKESSSADDPGIAQKAADAIRAHKPGAMLVHFGNNDKVGHAKGWGSPEQFEAMAQADRCAGMVIQALKDAGIYNDTLIILSADHGGSGKTHGLGDPRSRYIPWIAVGPMVKKDFDLTTYRDVTVHTEDTFATACHYLGLPLPEGTQGEARIQIAEGYTPEMAPATKPAKAKTQVSKAP